MAQGRLKSSLLATGGAIIPFMSKTNPKKATAKKATAKKVTAKRSAAKRSTVSALAPSKHDSREAIDLLATAAHNPQADRDRERDAACALIDALVELKGKTKAVISRVASKEIYAVDLQVAGAEIRVQVDGDGDGLRIVDLTDDRSSLVRVEGLSYNPATGLYDADAYDRTLAPIPGKPFPVRRSALAVVVEAAMRCARLLPPPTP